MSSQTSFMRKLLMMLLTIIVQPFTRGCQQYASITLANATEPSLLAGLLVDALENASPHRTPSEKADAIVTASPLR